jgi:predicted GIY-YIG superfamily endonuclease
MHGPVTLVYVEEVEDHGAALKREIQIKRYSHQKKANMAGESPLPEEFVNPDE